MRIKNKRLMSMTILLLVFLISDIGCVKKEVKQKKGDIITFAFWGDPFNASFSKRIVKSFHEKYPDITVKIMDITSPEYETKLLTLVAGGAAPDIMLVMPPDLPDLASRGILLNLQEYMKKEAEFQRIGGDIFPHLLEVNKYDGIPYSVPIWTNTMALYYNKTLFDEEHIMYPDERWDWDAFVSAAQKLTKDLNGDGITDQFGTFALNIGLGGHWGNSYRYIRQNGAFLYNDDKTKCLLDSPEAIEAIQWCIDLRSKHHVTPNTKELESFRDINEMFVSGRAAMIVTGRWMMPIFNQVKNLDYGIAVEPKGRQKTTCMASVLIGIYSKTKYPDASWKFLRYMTEKEAQTVICDERMDIPILRSIAYSPLFLNKFSSPEKNRIFLESLEYAEQYPSVKNTNEWITNAGVKLALVQMGEKGLREACKEIVQEYDIIVTNR